MLKTKLLPKVYKVTSFVAVGSRLAAAVAGCVWMAKIEESDGARHMCVETKKNSTGRRRKKKNITEEETVSAIPGSRRSSNTEQ